MLCQVHINSYDESEKQGALFLCSAYWKGSESIFRPNLARVQSRQQQPSKQWQDRQWGPGLTAPVNLMTCSSSAVADSFFVNIDKTNLLVCGWQWGSIKR